jgi:hypothetical protein
MKAKVAFGSVLLMLGFIAYQLGTSMIVLPKSYPSIVANSTITPLFLGQTTEFVAAFLQYGGGVVAFLGLIVAIIGVAASGEIEALQSSVQRLQSSVQVLQTSAYQPQPSVQRLSCRFCGASIEKDEFFCPTCGRAQV